MPVPGASPRPPAFNSANLTHPGRNLSMIAGVSEVLVNGTVTVTGGRFAGPLAGRALAGPGRRP